MSRQERAERRKQWNFVITDQGWSWMMRKPDGTEERSRKSYPTLKAAADDAIKHGYAAWKSGERRQLDD